MSFKMFSSNNQHIWNWDVYIWKILKIVYICLFIYAKNYLLKVGGNYGKMFLLQLITIGKTQLKQSTQNAKQIYETFIEQMKKYVLFKKEILYLINGKYNHNRLIHM